MTQAFEKHDVGGLPYSFWYPAEMDSRTRMLRGHDTMRSSCCCGLWKLVCECVNVFVLFALFANSMMQKKSSVKYKKSNRSVSDLEIPRPAAANLHYFSLQI